MINNFKYIEKWILKTLILGFFIFISVSAVMTDLSNDYERAYDVVIVTELIDADAIFSELYLLDFNPEFLTGKDIDRLLKENGKYFISNTNTKLKTAFELSQRRYLTIKPILLTVSNPMLSSVITYEDYPSVS